MHMQGFQYSVHVVCIIMITRVLLLVDNFTVHAVPFSSVTVAKSHVSTRDFATHTHMQLLA